MSPRSVLVALFVLLVCSSIGHAAPNRILMRFGRSDPALRPQNLSPPDFFRPLEAAPRFGDAEAPSAAGNFVFEPIE
ncbi:hypothetical protein QR680_018099 [Steinernema hermaphroditum]|uniref:Uncharacterized protein n=1 Tax=Steinernema hermaphroditum TaxID=289476 RepID=A0AA39LPU6_9BILA|nr:hypothetical protein QR680_018099 [Steinernema hermaphroditum]